MMAGFVVIKRLVLVEQVVLRQQAGVDIAVLKVETRNALVMDMRELLAGAVAEDVLEDEEVALGEDDAAAGEGGVDAGLTV